MILIVADTGPINYLILIGCESVLPEMVRTVVLPATVVHELQAGGAPMQVRKWAENLPPWIEVREPTQLISAQPEISEADRSAISLAKELQALLLMDDRRARRAAEDWSVTTIGTLGILEAAAAKDLVSLPDALARLRKTNMFLPEDLLVQAIHRDAARQAAKTGRNQAPPTTSDA